MRIDTLGLCFLMLAGAVVAWTGIFGPTTPIALKDWQPLMAALIALAGGSLAYRGAMAKIYEDREREKRDIQRRRMGLCLRLRFAAEGIRKEADGIVGAFAAARDMNMGTGRYDYRFKSDRLRFKNRQEFEEAWSNLELLPMSVSVSVETVRHYSERIDNYLNDFEDGFVTVAVPWAGHSDAEPEGIHQTDIYILLADPLVKAAKIIINDLDREISRLENSVNVA
jgi:hypothetical protein